MRLLTRMQSEGGVEVVSSPPLRNSFGQVRGKAADRNRTIDFSPCLSSDDKPYLQPYLRHSPPEPAPFLD